MNARILLVIGLLLFGAVVYGIKTDKMRVTTVCRDARLYMDGGIDAEIESGGLSFHRDAKLFRRINNKEVYLGTYIIDKETPAHEVVQVFSSGEEMKLSIFKNRPQNPHGYQGRIEADLERKKISVDINCLAKSI